MMRALLAWFDLALALIALAWIGHELHLVLVDRMIAEAAGQAPHYQVDLPNLLLISGVALFSLLHFFALRRRGGGR